MPTVLVWLTFLAVLHLTHWGEGTHFSVGEFFYSHKMMANLQYNMDCDLQWEHAILHASDLGFSTREGFDLCT